MPNNTPAAHLSESERRLADEVSRLREQLRVIRLRLLEADRQLQDVLDSDSWQATEVLRRMSGRFPGLSRAGMRLWKPLAWTMLGQLHARVRSRRLRQPRRHDVPALQAQPAPTGEVSAASLVPRAPAPGGQTILIVDAAVPQPDRNAGARNTASYISALLEAGWSVVFAPFDGLNAAEHTQALSAQGALVVDARAIGGLPAWLAAHGATLDHVLLMRPRPAIAMLPLVLEHTDARISYYGHDLHHVRLRQQAELARDIDLHELAEREFAVEQRIWRTVDVVLYPSVAEAAAVAAAVPGVAVAALPVMAFEDFPAPHPPPDTADILFVGNFLHHPNEDAALWFADAVFPGVRAARTDARFVVAGSGPTPRVLALAGAGIEVTDYLSEEALRRRYDTARVVVAPLRFGAGVKGKVVEAMRYGVPVVTTSVGAEGMPGLEGIVLVYDEPAAMAEAVLRLIANEAVWTDQAEAGISYARKHFSADALRESLLGALGRKTPA